MLNQCLIVCTVHDCFYTLFYCVHNRNTRRLNDTIFPVMFINEVRNCKDMLTLDLNT